MPTAGLPNLTCGWKQDRVTPKRPDLRKVMGEKNKIVLLSSSLERKKNTPRYGGGQRTGNMFLNRVGVRYCDSSRKGWVSVQLCRVGNERFKIYSSILWGVRLSSYTIQFYHLYWEYVIPMVWLKEPDSSVTLYYYS